MIIPEIPEERLFEQLDACFSNSSLGICHLLSFVFVIISHNSRKGCLMQKYSQYNPKFDGCSWESMMHMLLSHMDSHLKNYSRSGRDNGIDAISGDGLVVYQAKYHEKPSIDSCIKDLHDEMRKVGGYRKKIEYWKPVEKWVLFTNVEKNPNDEQKWEDAVAKCGCHGLKIELWDWTRVWSLLEDYPEVKMEFIDDQRRCFLSEREFAGAYCKNYLPESLDIECVGREKELREFDEFLNSDKRIWAVSGPGGMGKTRFLLECAKRVNQKIFRVFFGMPEVMKITPSWHERLVFEHQAILFIDELGDLTLLRSLIGMLSQEAKRWKVVFSERNANAKTIKELELPKYETINKKTCCLSRLNFQNQKALTERLLNCIEVSRKIKFIDKEKSTHNICKISQGIPLWICLVVKSIVQNNGTLGEDFEQYAFALYENYTDSIKPCLDEIPITVNCYDAVLRWCSLYKEFSLNQTDVVNFISSKANVDKPVLEKTFQLMVQTGLMQKFGYEGKTYSICPDVIREHILKENLLSSQGLSAWGEEIVDELIHDRIPNATAVVESMSHIENTLPEDKIIDVLGTFVVELERKIETADVEECRKIFSLFKEICVSRTTEILEIIKRQMDRCLALDAEENFLWGCSHDIRGVLEICLYCCDDFYSRKLCLENIIALSKRCKASKRYGDFFVDALRPIFESDLRLDYKENVDEFLDVFFRRIETDGFAVDDYSVLGMFLEGIFSVKCNTVENFNMHLSFRSGFFSLELISSSFEWMDEIQKVLEQYSIPVALSNVLVDCYGKFFNNVLQYPETNFSQKEKDLKYGFLEDRLKWVASYITSGYGLKPEIRNCLREKVWSWLLKYRKQNGLWKIAEQCENAYCINKADKNILDFLNKRYDENEDSERRNFVCQFLSGKKAKDVLSFIDRLSYYAGYRDFRIDDVAYEYGRSLVDKKFILSVMRQIADKKDNIIYKRFYFSLIKGVVTNLADVDELLKMAREFLKHGFDSIDVLRSCLIEKRFLCKKMYNLLKKSVQNKNTLEYARLMIDFTLNMPAGFLKEIDLLWDNLSEDVRYAYLDGMLDNAYAYASGWSKKPFIWNNFSANWIVDKIAKMKDIGCFSHNNHCFEKLKPLFSSIKNVQWLYEVLLYRKKMGYHLAHDFSLAFFVHSEFDEIERRALTNIIDLMLCHHELYGLEAEIALIDLENKCVGQIIVDKFKTAMTEEDKLTYVSIAGYFRDESLAWFEISAEVCTYARRLPKKQRIRFWSELDWRGIETFSCTYGTVAKMYYEHVSHFEKMVADSKYSIQNEYFRSRLDIAKRRLRDAEEEAKALRGE